MAVVGPSHDQQSRTFDLDPVLGIERLLEAYFACFPGHERGITAPAIVDIPIGQVVTNDVDQMTIRVSISSCCLCPRPTLPAGSAHAPDPTDPSGTTSNATDLACLT